LVQEAWKAGATKCLSKSNCTPRHLLDAVRGALGQTVGTASLERATVVPAPPAAAGAPVASDRDDQEFQTGLHREFVASLPANLTTLRTSLKAMVKADNDTARLQQMQVLYHRIHPLTGNAAVAGLVHIAQMGDALEFLLKELIEKPKNLNVSTLRTVANAVDFLGFLFEHGTRPEKQDLSPPKILVVDDEAISRRALTYALEKAKLKSESCDNPASALNLVTENRYDLLFLDVDMPGMSGFELCTKLRSLPQHKKTPVVFVTSLNDFESRANSTMSGGNDFIGKPFLFIELAVKALIHVQRSRLMPAR
jgi:CheY-like chemotaxis protein